MVLSKELLKTWPPVGPAVLSSSGQFLLFLTMTTARNRQSTGGWVLKSPLNFSNKKNSHQ